MAAMVVGQRWRRKGLGVGGGSGKFRVRIFILFEKI